MAHHNMYKYTYTDIPQQEEKNKDAHIHELLNTNNTYNQYAYIVVYAPKLVLCNKPLYRIVLQQNFNIGFEKRQKRISEY